MTIAQKILRQHLRSGTMQRGERIAIQIDQTLTQDATGTMVYLQFESLGLEQVNLPLAVSYVDHNTNQLDFKNPDDHAFLKTAAARYGAYFSKPGNGICHQVNLERFGKPGATLLGADSHTPTGGGIGMLAIGAGGLDIALAMAGYPVSLTMPGIVNVRLSGQLPPWVTAKDVILELLRRETVKGGVGWIYEYSGDGVQTLSVPERATITNMGAELGATTSIFPSDDVTRKFLNAQGREHDWIELHADPDAVYDREIHLDLSTLEPLAACPHMPDQVRPLRDLEAENLKVDQVAIGSCTNSSYKDLMTVAHILKDKKVHPDCSLAIAPGSRQVLNMIAEAGGLTQMIAAGARIMENACGACVGMGFAPPTDSVSFRTFNRNFRGRCGTPTAGVYLVSPETAAVAALEGRAVDPRRYGAYPQIEIPERVLLDDSMLLAPPQDRSSIEIIRGPNIKPLPPSQPLPEKIASPVLLKVGDNITTDDIMPAGRYLSLRSNVPEYAKHVFEGIDPSFYERAMQRQAQGSGIIIGGENYGQGSAREHAALCPMYLGIRVVLVTSFARIHLANLINFGILPLTFVRSDDYNNIDQGDELSITLAGLNAQTLVVHNHTKNIHLDVAHALAGDEIDIVNAGGKLAYVMRSA
ncbi:aconitate hydratase [candidate division KSB3 bacterium]|uniref:Aconitate hydratase n=1 Tax=candidate division KSB3 bacterium TaxID=2044937 RepID=A0A9D5JU00_9BACT|nr:aconitate hydratase [candidate division KSB3 bacterium]MBD3324204.1 aconitate hydratase [candidate division KSB3 bacterium]